MRKIDLLLQEYGESHQTDFNKKVHYVCVPAIFFSVIGLLACVKLTKYIAIGFPSFLLSFIHLGMLLIVLGLFYYLRLSLVMALGMLVLSLITLILIALIEQLNVAPLWLIMMGVFIIAWIGQFIGHKHEGKKPSFFKDLQFLMIGPAWTLSHFFDHFKVKY